MKIVEKTNCIIDEFEKAYKNGCRIFICGGGSGAITLYQKVCKSDGRNIPIEAFVLNDNYYDSTTVRTILDFPVIPMRELDKNDPSVFLCIGYMHYDYFQSDFVPPKMNGLFIHYDITTFFDKTGTGSFLDYEYINENMDYDNYTGRGFNGIYSQLSDKKSRDVMDAYFNQRISGKYTYIEKVRDKNQYYDDEIVDIKRIEGFVDCGAYNGDSYESFISNFKRRTKNDYSGFAWLWEMEKNNLHILAEKYSQNDNKIKIIPFGVGKEKSNFHISGSGTSGTIVESGGEEEIQIDSIDNIIDRKVDFIKMDIEGSELNALLGAKTTIQKYKPILAISVYHKREDLLTIPALIRTYYSEYKFYLRAYSLHSTEIILYAIP